MNLEFTNEIIELAKEQATSLGAGEVREVSFGQESGTFWLSDDASKIIGAKAIDLDGKNFFLGLFKK